MWSSLLILLTKWCHQIPIEKVLANLAQDNKQMTQEVKWKIYVKLKVSSSNFEDCVYLAFDILHFQKCLIDP